MNDELNCLNEHEKIKVQANANCSQPSPSTKISHLKYRLLKTFVLFLSWIALGLFSEILGPALPALRTLTDSDHEEISRALSSRAVGLLIGSIVGGILADLFMKYRNILIFIFLSLAGLTVATLPLCRTLAVLAFNLFISGFSHGAFTTSGNPSLGSLWKEKSTGPYNFMHSGYGLGAAISPLLISSFDFTNTNSSINSTLTKETATFIQNPFLIVGLYCIFVALIFLMYCFFKNPTEENDASLFTQCFRSKTESINTNVEVKTPYFSMENFRQNVIGNICGLGVRARIVMGLCFISYFALVGNERVFGKFQFSYAIEGSLQMSKRNGYLINCLYWVSFCLARIIIAILALKISPKILLISEIMGALISSVVFTLWNNSEIVFFIFSTTFGFFKSPLFPTMLGVLSLYITISGVLVVIVNLGSAAGAAFCQYLAGYLIHHYGHYTFPLTVTGTSAFLLAVFLIVILVTRKWKVRQ